MVSANINNLSHISKLCRLFLGKVQFCVADLAHTYATEGRRKAIAGQDPTPKIGPCPKHLVIIGKLCNFCFMKNPSIIFLYYYFSHADGMRSIPWNSISHLVQISRNYYLCKLCEGCYCL